MNMANIIDLPDFMFNYIDRNNFSKMQKIFLFLKGVIVSLFYKVNNKKLFSKLTNIFFQNDGKIFVEDNKYCKKLKDDYLIYYPNKRIDRVVVDHQKHFDLIYQTYCLHKIKFQNGDSIIDCGANVGELYYSFKYKNLDINYLAFEPDKQVYKSLLKNMDPFNQKTYNIALSNKEREDTFYSDSFGANSSLVKFENYSDSYIIKTIKLDSLNLDKIKLLKLEAEGFELEVLEGSVKTLDEIEYVSVDYGPERGMNSELTIAQVTNFLYKNNFKIIEGSRYRFVGLFKNNKFN